MTPRRRMRRFPALVALLGLGCATPPSVAPTPLTTPTPSAPAPLRLPALDVEVVDLALLPVDDDAELFRGDEGGIGIGTAQLTVPLGHDPSGERIAATRFAASVHRGESDDLQKTRARAQRFIATLSLPAERAFIVEHWVTSHERQPSPLEFWQGQATPVEGYTLVLVETRPILERTDFGEAELWHPPEGEGMDGYLAVVQLTERGAQRLRAHFERAPHRRVSLVHRGEALTTPVMLAAPPRIEVWNGNLELLQAAFGDLPVHEGLPPELRTD